MAIPRYDELMLPVLELLEDGQLRHIRDLLAPLATRFGLSAQERSELMQSGQRLFDNRVHWARLYLKNAGLLASPARAHIQITERGRSVLQSRPGAIDKAYLTRYAEFNAWLDRSRERHADSDAPQLTSEGSETPDELLERAVRTINDSLARSLHERLASCSPSFFEQVVLDVLFAMGYGGSERSRLQVTGGVGDEGIDGTIFEDKLGLDVIYIQAKRWANTVGRPELQRFAGALQGQRARKGVFVTTSQFSSEARDYASAVDTRIVLIDGVRLAELMIEFGVGVFNQTTYVVRRMDADYFEEAD